MTICENGIPKCAICVASEPTPAELHAARELAKYLRKISGANFKITRGIPETGPAIIVADIAQTPLAGTRHMTTESILRKTDNDRLFLLGADPRGTLIGVYDFLRSELGCVFPQRKPSDEYMPTKLTIDVPEMDYYHEPFLQSRYYIGSADLEMLDWAAKVGMSCAGPLDDIKKTLGWEGERPFIPDELANRWVRESITLRGQAGISIWSHASRAIMHPSKYFDEHPEYYAYNPDQRPDAMRQLKGGRDSFGICWTHPEVNRIYREFFLELFAQHPYVTRFIFFPNDGQPPCYCDECRKVEDPWEGKTTNNPQYTKNYVIFTAGIARAVAEKFPHVRMEIGSYSSHTELPDDFNEALPDNLDVQFCVFERKWDRALDDPPSDEELRETLPKALVSSYEKDASKYTQYHELFEKWRKHANGEFHYYDYLTSTAGSCGMLFPVSKSSCRTIHYLKSQGFSGYGTQWWYDASVFWASYGLSMYTTARTMWDGDAKWEDLAREYCRGFYHDAEDPMFRFFKTLEDSAHNVRFGMGLPEILQIFDQQTYDRCRALLMDAKSASVSVKVKRRIEDQEMLLEFGHLFWRTRQIEVKIEDAIKEDRLDDTFALLEEHLKVDHSIQKLFDRPLLRERKFGIFRHLIGHLDDKRGILQAVKLMKDATNTKNRDMWYEA